MMGVILTILKVIGIILLVILGILLVLLLLLLFVPMRYRLHVRRINEVLEADGRMTWLLSFLRADLTYQEKQGTAVIRVLGFRLKTFEFPRREEAPFKDSPGESAEGSGKAAESTDASDSGIVNADAADSIVADAADSAVTDAADSAVADAADSIVADAADSAKTGTSESEEETIAKRRKLFSKLKRDKGSARSKNAADSGKKEKKEKTTHPGFIARLMDKIARLLNLALQMLLKLPGLPAELYDKIDEILDKFERKYDSLQRKIDPFLSIEAEHMFEKGIRYLRFLLVGYAPRSISGYIHFGTGYPDLTGKLTGLAYVLLPEAGTEYDVDPDFYESVLETDTFIKGHIRAYRLAWVGIRLLLDREFWILLARIRGRERKSGHRGRRRFSKSAVQNS